MIPSHFKPETGWIYSAFPYRKLIEGVHSLHVLHYQGVILHSGLHGFLQSFIFSVLQQRLSVILAFKVGLPPEPKPKPEKTNPFKSSKKVKDAFICS